MAEINAPMATNPRGLRRPFFGKEFLLVVDSYSKYPEVFEMTTKSTAATIEQLRYLYTRHGIPETLVSDKGTQFTSNEFAKFTEKKWNVPFIFGTVQPHVQWTSGAVRGHLQESFQENERGGSAQQGNNPNFPGYRAVSRKNDGALPRKPAPGTAHRNRPPVIEHFE
uniref:Integrase catalytic domain-containing protein n=1 Tax=Globodera pallida TaxID=36090 RepID=A0A183CGC4_GLOPA